MKKRLPLHRDIQEFDLKKQLLSKSSTQAECKKTVNLRIGWVYRGGDGWWGLLHFDGENCLRQLIDCSRLPDINSILLPVLFQT